MRADLRVEAAEFVPAAAVEAEEGEVVGAGVEGHCGIFRGWKGGREGRKGEGGLGGCIG